ncbi:MAG: succinyl-CoA--3-ketoacid-CoA transferase [Elusimicrobia bacterium GWA2_56_46]|nr:MAG: succinyl-CoA--3-ketoacid-CoA transferase [Elusimicrobia bacterium GWA2_56_46]OGR54104.1 MAG: succinyl-CoA--3-ketoacid-CoA transferase [Elusimicrobia bacterium GWC2_56_31]HBW22952.1 succinyl-CoA--3-ketoacid-CoA transferase [Elusimicrobiota bacterium]
MDPKELKRIRIVRRIAQEFPDGALVNLGIGMPTLVADHLPGDRTILLHSENGFTGLGPRPAKGKEDPRLVNAGGQPVTIVPGGCFFDSAMSFAIIRGGHVDYTVLGALEVDEEGSLANYMIPGKMVPGMGGAMDLVTGAKNVIIAMEHVTRDGAPKILKKCTLPLTAKGEVDLIVTDLAFIRVTKKGLVLEEIAEGATVEEVIKNTGAKLHVAGKLGRF